MSRTLARTLARTSIRLGGAVLIALGLAAPASAQIVQSAQFSGGWFFPRGFDSRALGDVLVADAMDKGTIAGLSDALAFRMRDFIGGNVHGEWNVAFGPRVEVGASFGFYQQTVHSVYYDLVNLDGSEIRQDLQLRVTPIMGIVRFTPFGRIGGTQPYVGAGFGALNFRYTESGQFVDPTDLSIFNDRYIATGTVPGVALLGGIHLPLGGDVYGLNVEYRYQWGVGNTGGPANGFLDDKIDLGGGYLNFGFRVRF